MWVSEGYSVRSKSFCHRHEMRAINYMGESGNRSERGHFYTGSEGSLRVDLEMNPEEGFCSLREHHVLGHKHEGAQDARGVWKMARRNS